MSSSDCAHDQRPIMGTETREIPNLGEGTETIEVQVVIGAECTKCGATW